MFCDILNPDGNPYEGDPRQVLKRNLKKAADKGFTFYVGPEAEYFYFRSPQDPEPLDQGGYFDLIPRDEAVDLRRETVLALEQMGIYVEYSHHEVAPSQHEIDLRYTDALTMADNLMTYRTDGQGDRLHERRVCHLHAQTARRRRMVPACTSTNRCSKASRTPSSMPNEQVFPERNLQALYRRPPEIRAGIHRGDQPVGELLQAPGAGL